MEGSELVVLRIRNSRIYDFALQQAQEAESLDDLSVAEVFERCLESNRVEEVQRQLLREAFAEVRETLARQDGEAESGP